MFEIICDSCGETIGKSSSDTSGYTVYCQNCLPAEDEEEDEEVVDEEEGKEKNHNMPIIEITQDALDRGKDPADGWHLFEIEKFSETDSKDKQSKNWMFELRCVDEDENKGRYGYARFNSKMAIMLVKSGFLPGALDTPVEKAITFNPDELRGKRLYGCVKTEVYEGKPQKRTEEFTSASKVPF